VAGPCEGTGGQVELGVCWHAQGKRRGGGGGGEGGESGGGGGGGEGGGDFREGSRVGGSGGTAGTIAEADTNQELENRPG
jgi:hypothetical protein